MRRAIVMLVGAVLAAGCNDDNDKLAALDTARQLSAANLETEAANRRAGDLDAISQARSYTDQQLAGSGLGAKVEAEAEARIKGDADTLKAAEAYTNILRGAITEGHLQVRASKVDLGRHRGGTVTAAQVNKQDVDIDWVTPITVAWSSPNCTGAGFVRGIGGSLASTFYIVGLGGQLANIDSELGQASTVSETKPDGSCQLSTSQDMAYAVNTLVSAKQTDAGLEIVRFKGRELRTFDALIVP